MSKTLTGGALISYGPLLPSISTTPDGSLFYKTDGLVGGPSGLYLLGFVKDSNDLALGPQVSQSWIQAVSPDLFVVKSGDTMTGELQISGNNTTSTYGAGERALQLRNSSTTAGARGGAIRWTLGSSTNISAQIDVVQNGTTNQSGHLTFGTRDTVGGVTERMRIQANGIVLINGGTVWHSGNDGAGSGLDADTLDGVDSAVFRDATNIFTSGLVPIVRGGTNNSATPIAGSIVYGNGTQHAISAAGTAPSGSGTGQNWQVLTSNGAAAPAWVDATSLNVSFAATATNANFANSATTAGSATTATTATNANNILVVNGAGGYRQLNYTLNAGQPTAVWGTSNSGATIQAWNPANFNVATATTATNNVLKAGDQMTGLLVVDVDGISTSPNQNLAPVTVLRNGTTLGANNRAFFGLRRTADGTGTGGTNWIHGIDSTANYTLSNYGNGTVYTTNLGTPPDFLFSTTGNFTAQGNVTAFSDARMKRNVKVIENALDKVDALVGVTFTRIKDGSRGTGLVAQDVKAVLPEAIATHDDGLMSVAYGNMVGLLVEAIKELRAEVAALKN